MVTTNTEKMPFSLLITDDDQSFRETLQEILEPEGFTTILAESGEEALEIIQFEPVHLALMDYHMPHLTGLDTLRIIRRRLCLLPVILLTADRTPRVVQEAQSAQAFCVIAKPVEKKLVVHTVQQALECYYSGSVEPHHLGPEAGRDSGDTPPVD